MSVTTEPKITPQGGMPSEQDSDTTSLQSDAAASDASADSGQTDRSQTAADQGLSDIDARFLRAFRNLTADEDHIEDSGNRITLRSVLGGDLLSGEWFQKQILYILLLVMMIIFYTSNRYACQQEILESKTLTDTLLDRRYKALTRAAQLKQTTRRSHIEQVLTDTTIQTAVIPPYYLKVEEE